MRTKWFFLGCLTSVILGLGIITLSFLGLMKLSSRYAKDRVAKLDVGTVLHVKLSGQIIEYNEYFDNYFTETGTGAHQLIQKIKSAAKDPKVEALLLEPVWISCGYAVLNEIKQSLEDFKSSGKKVYAYLERAGNKDYLLAASADQIFLNPSASGGILLTGIGSNMLFYKELFDKIGVEVTVIHAGEYKGFGESYSRTELSEPVRENLSNLFDEIFDNIVTDMALSREIQLEEAKFIYEKRPELFISNNKALGYGLVDSLLYFEEVVKAICPNSKNFVSLKKYNPAFTVNPINSKIAVVYLQGEIVEANLGFGNLFINFDKLDTILDDLEINPYIRGVVLRINSPGGSALESEIIHKRIEEFKLVKPLVISMSNVAASGGYYISAPGDVIFADPYTITGSIGVATIIPNFKKLADKIGITSEPLKRGKYVDVFNGFAEPDKSTLTALKASSDGIYAEFLGRVSEGRDIDLNELINIAGGRVWTSRNALEFGLIDEIGILHDAIEKASELAGIEEYDISYFPAQKSVFEEFIKQRFNIDYITSYINRDLDEQFELTKLRKRYINLKNDPIQAIIPFELE